MLKQSAMAQWLSTGRTTLRERRLLYDHTRRVPRPPRGGRHTGPELEHVTPPFFFQDVFMT